MKYRIGQSLFYLLIAVFLVFAALFLFQDAGTGYEVTPAPARKITPYFNLDFDPTVEKKVTLYPAEPNPGDFLILEVGPVLPEAKTALRFDFPGAVSTYYRLGSLFYAVIAISYNTEPGLHIITLEIDSPGEAIDQKEIEVMLTEREFQISRFSMPAGTTAGWTAARLAEDREKIRLAREESEAHPLWQHAFISPLEGRISSEYGAIRYINNNPPRRHSGIDIAIDEGTPIIAPNAGIVRLAEFLLSGGNTVIIDHGMNLSSTYMHLHTMAVEAGDFIERGELIGTVGMTGYATGPHLHWEVNIGQIPVNPEQLFENDLLWIPPAYTLDFLD